MLLKKINNKLETNSNYELLDSFKWIQNIDYKDDARFLFYEDKQKEYGLYLKFYRSRFLHADLKSYLGVIDNDSIDIKKDKIAKFEKKILKTKKNLRLIDGTNYISRELFKFVSFNQNIMIQSEDLNLFSNKNFKVVSKRKPTSKQLKDLIFAFNVCRYVKSNAIVLASNETTVGIGSGQPSRLDSCQIAINKMKKFNLQNNNLVAASDAFFPFVDGIEKLVQSGIRAVVQPSGSIRDKEIINFANETDTVLVFSKTRHFRH